MNAEQFAQFWEIQGHRVLRTESCWWYNSQPFVFMSIPYHREIEPSSGETLQVMLKARALVLRFPQKMIASKVAVGGLCICSDKHYDFPSLHVKARNQTRRALEQCKIERVAFRDLATIGHELNVQTFSRQGRDPYSFPSERWRSYCEAAEMSPDFEAWGCFVNDSLAAYCVCALVDDYYNILHQASATEHLLHYPNNALAFVVTQQALQRADVAFVSYGLKSIESTSGLDHFKERMGYHVMPRWDRIAINPLLGFAMRCGGDRIVSYLHDSNPGSDFWRKAKRTLDMLHSGK